MRFIGAVTTMNNRISAAWRVVLTDIAIFSAGLLVGLIIARLS